MFGVAVQAGLTLERGRDLVSAMAVLAAVVAWVAVQPGERMLMAALAARRLGDSFGTVGTMAVAAPAIDVLMRPCRVLWMAAHAGFFGLS